MATSLQFLSQCLDRHGMKHHIDREKSVALFGIDTQELKEQQITLHLVENGEFIHFVAPRLFFVKDSLHKGLFFQTALQISYTHKLLRFEYDPSDGEIRASIELPLEDAPLTAKQFDRCLLGLLSMLESSVPRLRSVLMTGIDPGEPTADRMIQELVDELPPELLEMFGHLGDAIQRRLHNQ